MWLTTGRRLFHEFSSSQLTTDTSRSRVNFLWPALAVRSHRKASMRAASCRRMLHPPLPRVGLRPRRSGDATELMQ